MARPAGASWLEPDGHRRRDRRSFLTADAEAKQAAHGRTIDVHHLDVESVVTRVERTKIGGRSIGPRISVSSGVIDAPRLTLFDDWLNIES